MARKKQEEPAATEPKKRVRKPRVVKEPPCWAKCGKFVVKDGTDYVHICLGDTFVTLEDLTRMMNSGSIDQTKEM